MKFLVVLAMAAVCAGAVEVWREFEAFPNNQPKFSLTHDQIAAKLASERLEPNETMLLLSSYGKNGHWPLFKGFYSYQITRLACASPDACYEDMLEARKRVCDRLEEARDDSTTCDNLMRLCRAAHEKVIEYCWRLKNPEPGPPPKRYYEE